MNIIINNNNNENNTNSHTITLAVTVTTTTTKNTCKSKQTNCESVLSASVGQGYLIVQGVQFIKDIEKTNSFERFFC